MMETEKLTNFLKDYAGQLGAEMDWSEVAPVYMESNMAGGSPRVKTRDGETMACFVTKGMSCSMPVSQRDIQGAKLLVSVINILGKLNQKAEESENE